MRTKYLNVFIFSLFFNVHSMDNNNIAMSVLRRNAQFINGQIIIKHNSFVYELRKSIKPNAQKYVDFFSFLNKDNIFFKTVQKHNPRSIIDWNNLRKELANYPAITELSIDFYAKLYDFTKQYQLIFEQDDFRTAVFCKALNKCTSTSLGFSCIKHLNIKQLCSSIYHKIPVEQLTCFCIANREKFIKIVNNAEQDWQAVKEKMHALQNDTNEKNIPLDVYKVLYEWIQHNKIMLISESSTEYLSRKKLSNVALTFNGIQSYLQTNLAKTFSSKNIQNIYTLLTKENIVYNTLQHFCKKRCVNFHNICYIDFADFLNTKRVINVRVNPIILEVICEVFIEKRNNSIFGRTEPLECCDQIIQQAIDEILSSNNTAEEYIAKILKKKLLLSTEKASSFAYNILCCIQNTNQIKNFLQKTNNMDKTFHQLLIALNNTIVQNNTNAIISLQLQSLYSNCFMFDF